MKIIRNIFSSNYGALQSKFKTRKKNTANIYWYDTLTTAKNNKFLRRRKEKKRKGNINMETAGESSTIYSSYYFC